MIHCELLIDGHFIGGPCDQATGKQLVRSPWDDHVVGTAAEGGFGELRGCIQAAHDAFPSWKLTTRETRQKLLRRIATIIRERADELSTLLTEEVGKPITWSQGEVARTALTFDLAADLITTYGLEQLPTDIDPRGAHYRCTVERFPIGPIFCMVPYNWPFNLAAHKIAPALATGNTLILKVSPLAPLSTLQLARIIHEAGCPPGVINAWNGPVQAVQKALTDDRIAMLSFTGSAAVGWKLKELLPTKKVVLELGGNATAIICSDADLDGAIPRIAAGAFGFAGQVCISVQHVLVHHSIYEKALAQLKEATANCPTGDPNLPQTICGPLISIEAAQKVEKLIVQAVDAGATLEAGGTLDKQLLSPTLLSNVPDSVDLAHEEAFGPILTIAPYHNLEEAIQKVNSSQYGIHCGVFTNDIKTSEHCYRSLEVGGVIINDYPTLRFDNMPYGGVKKSGFGREGIRYAMDEMTEPKTLLIKTK